MKVKLPLLESDFEEHWISFRVPIEIWKKLHFHPCEIEVDLTDLMDEHTTATMQRRFVFTGSLRQKQCAS